MNGTPGKIDRGGPLQLYWSLSTPVTRKKERMNSMAGKQRSSCRSSAPNWLGGGPNSTNVFGRSNRNALSLLLRAEVKLPTDPRKSNSPVDG